MSPIDRIIAALEPFAPRDMVQGLRDIADAWRTLSRYGEPPQ